MKLRKLTKKAGLESEGVIVWIIVIAVVLMAIIFIAKMNWSSIMKNLPGFKGEGEEDREIGIDETILFECKYPIGYITPGEKEFYFLNLKEVDETPLEEIGGKINNAQLANYLEIGFEGNIKYIEKEKTLGIFGGSETSIGNAKYKYSSTGKKEFFKEINFNENLYSFILNDWDNNLPGTKNEIGETQVSELKNNLRMLYDAKYYPNPGWLCANPEVIETLIEAEKCMGSCEIYGGDCIDLPEINSDWYYSTLKGGYLNKITGELVNKHVEKVDKNEYFYADESIYKTNNTELINNPNEIDSKSLATLEFNNKIYFISKVDNYYSLGTDLCENKKRCFINLVDNVNIEIEIKKINNTTLEKEYNLGIGKVNINLEKPIIHVEKPIRISINLTKKGCYTLNNGNESLIKGYEGKVDLEKINLGEKFRRDKDLILITYNPK